MVSQFVSSDRVRLLGELDFDFPEGTHAIGRLDNTSEGLLLLTTDKRVTKLLFQSDEPHKRTYLVRVSGHVTPDELQRLRTGVPILIEKDLYYTTPPCEVSIATDPPGLFPEQREQRPQVPHTWLYISLYEGKFRQVRKMVAAVGHHCRRLIRVSIEDMTLDGLPPGGVRELSAEEFFRRLRINITTSHSDEAAK